jgi:uroporphyrinogen decarboxylase
VDGSHSGGLARTRDLAPSLLAPFFEQLVPLLDRNIALQLDAGAEVVLILDTAAGELSPTQWKDWVLPSLASLARSHAGRVGYYMRGGTPSHWAALHEAALPLAGIGFDSALSMPEALRHARGFVQGNFHQEHMTLDESSFRRELDRWLEPIAALKPEDRRGWVCGLGHGLTPQAREQNVRTFVKTIRERLA